VAQNTATFGNGGAGGKGGAPGGSMGTAGGSGIASGGGIFVNASAPTLFNNLLQSNLLQSSQGTLIGENDYNGAVNPADTNNFVSNASGAAFNPATNILNNSNPQLDSLQPAPNGTSYYPLLPFVQSINGGTNRVLSTIANAEGVSPSQATDQIGNPRLVNPIIDIIDIGAAEFPGLPTTVSVASVSIPFTSRDPSITLSATVTGPEGILVNEGQVQFVLTTSSGSPLGQVVTANFSNGQFSTSFEVPAATPLGAYTITASYTDVIPGNFGPSTGTGKLTVVTSPTTVSVNNVNIVYSLFGEQETLTAVVLNALGQTVDEGLVTFSDGGQTVTVPIVNSLATATLNIPLFAENPFAHPIAVGYSNITNNFFASTSLFTLEQTIMDFLLQIMALESLLQSSSANA
jgi:hypothetical protein